MIFVYYFLMQHFYPQKNTEYQKSEIKYLHLFLDGIQFNFASVHMLVVRAI